MKLLLTMNLPYTRAHGGTNRSNRSLAEGLAAREHSIRVVGPALATPSPISHEELLKQMAVDGISVRSKAGVDSFNINGVEIHAVVSPGQLRGHLVEEVRAFDPDWVLVSAEDPSQNLLDAAMKVCPSRVIYLAHTPQMFPFGPASLYPSKSRTRLIGRAAAIITISRFVADYIKQSTGFDAFVNHPPHYGAGPFPNFGRFDSGYVLLMNACAVKGLPIFLSLARDMPNVQFAALRGYGTTSADLAALSILPNVTLLENRNDLDDILSQTRVLLMPSLWVEGFGMAVVDAMLRGIPTLASNFGGLLEAKLGTDYLLPVRPIERFEERLDENMLPVPSIPDQDTGPWLNALSALLADSKLYESQSASARDAAIDFVSNLSVAPLEELLNQLNGRHEAGGDQHMASSRIDDVDGGTPDEGGMFEDLAKLTPEQRALLIMRLQKKVAAGPENKQQTLPIERVSRDGPLPLSFAQQRLWFLDQLVPGNSLHNVSAAVRVTGRLDVPALTQSLNEIVRRHESLRTTFDFIEGQPVQVIAPDLHLPLGVVDIRDLTEVEREAMIEELATEEMHRPFNLSEGPLIRITLLNLGDDQHVILFVIHHIISDGWSMAVLIREMGVLYKAFSSGEPSPLPEMEIQYADFAAWQRRLLQGEVLDKQLSFWKQNLTGATYKMTLPTDFPRPAAQTFRGSCKYFSISEPLSNALKKLSQQENCTLFIILLSSFAVLLNHLTKQDDLVIGTDIANRNRVETEGLIGFFINQLVLRTDLSGNPTFCELLARLRHAALAAYEHQDLPFDRLVEAIQPERRLEGSPLFQVKLVLQNTPRENLELPGLVLNPISVEHGNSSLDLTLTVSENPDGLDACFEYSTELFAASTIDRMIQHLKTLLKHIVAQPHARLDRLKELLIEAERQERLAKEKEIRDVRDMKFKNLRRKATKPSPA